MVSVRQARMNTCLFSLCKFYFPPFRCSPLDRIYISGWNKLTINSGTAGHAVKVYNFEGTQLSRVEPYSSFLRGVTPISATAFHPHRMMLACAAKSDTHINLFTCVEKKPAIVQEY